MLLNNYCNADLCGLVAFARCAALRVGCICAVRAGYRCNRRRCHAFDGGIFFEGGFFGINSTLIDAHTLPGQTEGLRVGCGWVGMEHQPESRAGAATWEVHRIQVVILWLYSPKIREKVLK